MFLNDEDRDEPPDQEEANSEEHGQIVSSDISSLNSMAGTSTSQSLRIKGSIKGVTVVVLVDGGYSHNFIHPNVVEKLKLEVEKVTTFCVYVVTGSPCSVLNIAEVSLSSCRTTFLGWTCMFCQFMVQNWSSGYNG